MQPRFNRTPSAERVTVKGPKAEARATHENNVHDVAGYMAQRQARKDARDPEVIAKRIAEARRRVNADPYLPKTGTAAILNAAEQIRAQRALAHPAAAARGAENYARLEVELANAHRPATMANTPAPAEPEVRAA